MVTNEELKDLVLIQMDRPTQRAMIWKEAVYDVIMGYLTVACDSQNLPAKAKKVLMDGIEDLHLLNIYDYDKLCISVNQTFWNLTKTLARSRIPDSVGYAKELSDASKVFVDKINQSQRLDKKIQDIIAQKNAVRGSEEESHGEAETK